MPRAGAGAFPADGRFRETTFLVEAFERSACYRKGEAMCTHCHDPHPAAGAGKGVGVECPMPKRMNALRFPARTRPIAVRPVR
ncbi:MAG: hypothetical protein ACK55L_04315 [bacterium]